MDDEDELEDFPWITPERFESKVSLLEFLEPPSTNKSAGAGGFILLLAPRIIPGLVLSIFHQLFLLFCQVIKLFSVDTIHDIIRNIVYKHLLEIKAT